MENGVTVRLGVCEEVGRNHTRREKVWQRFPGLSYCYISSWRFESGFFSPSWWRQYVPLKRRFNSTRLHGATSQNAVAFRDLVCRGRVCSRERVELRGDWRKLHSGAPSLLLFIEYYQNYRIKEDVMDGACSMRGVMRNVYRILAWMAEGKKPRPRPRLR
jgi:hypothetical protein